jgi:hypothetical protein
VTRYHRHWMETLEGACVRAASQRRVAPLLGRAQQDAS